MDLSKAESELIELIRLQDAGAFRLVLMHDGKDEWRAETQDLDSGARAVGIGPNFEQAWNDQAGLDVHPREGLNIRRVDDFGGGENG